MPFIRRNKKKGKKDSRSRGSNYSNINLFQKPGVKFFKSCPLSGKDAPIIDYKNINLLKKYVSDTNKILPSRITSVSQGKQRKLNNEIKKAKILGLI